MSNRDWNVSAERKGLRTPLYADEGVGTTLGAAIFRWAAFGEAERGGRCKGDFEIGWP